jgi:MoxR-like ATPase
VFGGADFSLHFSGFTGCGKSELAALAQQHFGPEMHAKRLQWLSDFQR